MKGREHVEKSGKKRGRLKMELGGRRLRTGGILAALIAAVAVFAVMLQTEKKMLTQYEKGVIYMAAQEIPQGTLLTEENWNSYFQVQELDKSCIPETALTTPEQVQGLVAAYDIDRGTLLTGGMFEELNLILEELEEPVIAGFKAEDLFQVAGGILRTGDRIHVYSVKEEETVLVWQELFVQQVFDSAGNRIDCGDEVTAAQRVNVYLSRGEVEQFYRELAEGSLRAVKVCEEGKNG